MNVESIMTSEVACCRPDTPLQEVAALMVEHRCGEIPVCDESRIPLGVVTDRDIVCRSVARGDNPLELRASDCMSRPVITATPDTTLEDCARLMEQYQVRRIPVLDRNGACCGMVAQADLATKSSPMITAEVVGRISEETGASSGVAH
jgi:CBS domain-containing protein